MIGEESTVAGAVPYPLLEASPLFCNYDVTAGFCFHVFIISSFSWFFISVVRKPFSSETLAPCFLNSIKLRTAAEISIFLFLSISVCARINAPGHCCRELSALVRQMEEWSSCPERRPGFSQGCAMQPTLD